MLFVLCCAREEDLCSVERRRNLAIFGGEIGNDEEKCESRVVRKVHQVTGENGFGARTHKSENDADARERQDDRPSPAKLSTVHDSEQNSRKNNTGPDAESFGEKRVEIGAENCLFGKRRDQYGHSHECKSHFGILENFLNRRVFGSLGPCREHHYEKRKGYPGDKVKPRFRRELGLFWIQFAPAQGLPKGLAVE